MIQLRTQLLFYFGTASQIPHTQIVHHTSHRSPEQPDENTNIGSNGCITYPHKSSNLLHIVAKVMWRTRGSSTDLEKTHCRLD